MWTPRGNVQGLLEQPSIDDSQRIGLVSEGVGLVFNNWSMTELLEKERRNRGRDERASITFQAIISW